MNNSKKIFVYFNHNSIKPEFLGTLFVQNVRGNELFSFEFNNEWLKNNPTKILDPDLKLYSGHQYSLKNNFGIFLDSSPDRWGRRLMLRREAILAKKNKCPIKKLKESDFLLGIYDQTRMGALRFKTDLNGKFLNDDSNLAAPPWTRLRELEEACRKLDDDEYQTEHEKWISTLIAPGSSLGGARPKASVLANDNSLWIAKFPAHNDSINVSGWEYATMMMARDCGLNTPECKLEKLSRYGSTFLVKRFDRDGEKRIHFSSAMTLLGKNDGASFEDGSSYLDIVAFILGYSSNPKQDLQELWTRIVFSIAVSNTDDHLRNHGFILTNNGWRLSPVYDLNPNPNGYGLSLNITEDDNSLDFSCALEVAEYFRLNKVESGKIIDKVISVVKNWKKYAKFAGISRAEQDFMQGAFVLVNNA